MSPGLRQESATPARTVQRAIRSGALLSPRHRVMVAEIPAFLWAFQENFLAKGMAGLLLDEPAMEFQQEM